MGRREGVPGSLLLFVLALWMTMPGAWAESAESHSPPPESGGNATTLGTMDLSPPVWMAVIGDKQGTRILVGARDPIFSGKHPHPVALVEDIGPNGLTLSRGERGRKANLVPGQALPGAKDLVFREAVLVKTQEFRHRLVGPGGRKILDGEEYLVEIRGTRAILQRDVEFSSPTALQEARLAAIKIAQVGPHTWEVSAKDIRTAMGSGEAILNSALADSHIDFTRDLGVGLEVKTPIADVRIDNTGFQITNPNLASRAGLQVGDRILQVNDTPINGYASLVEAYGQIKSNASIQTVNLNIERDGQPLTFTYRIR